MNKDCRMISEMYRQVHEQQLPGFVASDYKSQPAGGLGFKLVAVSTPQGDKIEINDDVLFKFGTSELVPGGEEKLAAIAKKIVQVQRDIKPETKIEIVGHTDAYELKPGVNQALSQQRAIKVLQVLQQNDVRMPMNSRGVGSAELKVALPKDSQYQIQGGKAPEIGRQQQQPNRRVELKFNPPLPRQIITQIAPPAQISGPQPQQQRALGTLVGPDYKPTPEEQKRWDDWKKQRGLNNVRRYFR